MRGVILAHSRIYFENLVLVISVFSSLEVSFISAKQVPNSYILWHLKSCFILIALKQIESL
jgi:hypothetical protein